MDTDPGKWSRLYLGVVGPVAFVRGVIVAAELGRYLLRRPVTSCCHEGDKTENVSNRHSRQLANREKGGGTATVARRIVLVVQKLAMAYTKRKLSKAIFR
jgi:hypothetical protein